jgi:hypothetical protein
MAPGHGPTGGARRGLKVTRRGGFGKGRPAGTGLFPSVLSENDGERTTHDGAEGRRLPVCRGLSSALCPLFLQQPFQELDLLRQGGVGIDQAFDLAHCVQHRRMVAPAEPAADLRQ